MINKPPSYKVIPKGNYNGDYGYKVLRSGVDKALDNRALGPGPPKNKNQKTMTPPSEKYKKIPNERT